MLQDIRELQKLLGLGYPTIEPGEPSYPEQAVIVAAAPGVVARRPPSLSPQARNYFPPAPPHEWDVADDGFEQGARPVLDVQQRLVAKVGGALIVRCRVVRAGHIAQADVLGERYEKGAGD